MKYFNEQGTMNNEQWFALAAAVFLLVCASCSFDAPADAPAPDTGGKEVRFSTGAITAARARTAINGGVTEWALNDPVGIFMTGGGTANNKKYLAAANGNLSPDTGNTIYYPAGGGAVNFIAYYPWDISQTTLSTPYGLNVATQTNPADIDVLYGTDDSTGKTKASGQVEITFVHVLSKLKLNVTKDNTSVTSLHNLAVKINMETQAPLDLSNGTVGVGTTKTLISPVISQGATATDDGEYEAILLPGVSGATVQFELTDGTYSWNLPVLSGGTFHEYDLTVTKTGIVVSDGRITLWAGISDAPTAVVAGARYGIALTNNANSNPLDTDTHKYTFTAADFGYGAQTALTVRAANTGFLETGALTVGLSGTNSTSFALSDTSVNSIAVSGYATFTVTPATGLSAGTHTATVTVSNSNGINETFGVSFTVNAATYGIALTNNANSNPLDTSTNKHTFTAATAGYGAQTALTVKATNTGNQPTGALTVGLSGTNSTSFTLSTSSVNSIAVSGSATFTVTPATGLSPGTYTATVTVSGGNGISAAFGVSFTVNLAAPTGVSAVTVSSTSIKITWNAVSGAASYKVYRSLTSGSGYVEIANSVTLLEYTDTGLTTGTRYYYKVSAVNGSVEGSLSTEVSAVAPYAVGDTGPAGGLIFRISGTSYYEAAPASEDFSAVWGQSLNVTGVTEGVGGLNNTNLIIAALGNYYSGNYAANLCKNLSISYGGTTYTDWFLPSYAELMWMGVLYNNGNPGGFQSGWYWSSSQCPNPSYSSSLAISINFSNSTENTNDGKYNSRFVRAIRTFSL